MGIEDLKRWHWIAIGLVLGLAVSYARTGMEPDVGRNNVMEFIRDVNLPLDPKDGGVIRGIVIHPAQGDFRAEAALQSAGRKESAARAAESAAKKPPDDMSDAQRAEFVKQRQREAQALRAEAKELRATADQNKINIVSYQRLMRNRKDQTRHWQAQQFIAEIPFKTYTRSGGGVGQGGTIADYLDGLAKQNPNIKYRNAWWGTQSMQYAIWTGGCVLAIGVLWPNVLNALLTAGYGRVREPRKKRDSLFAYKSHPDAKPVPKPRVTAADEQRLREMTDQLERDLAANAAHHGDQPAAAAASSSVRKLEGGPLEAAAIPANPNADDEIEIKGEYYPVLIHHKKHHENEDQPQEKTPEP